MIIITPPPVDAAGWLARLRSFYPKSAASITASDRDCDAGEPYVRACQRVAHEMGVPCVSLFDLMQQHPPQHASESSPSAESLAWAAYLSDGLHLSASGQEFVFQRLMETIRRDVPSMAPERLSEHMPFFKALRVVHSDNAEKA